MLLTLGLGFIMGLVGGVLAGLFGIGGGVVLVPMLAAWLSWQGQPEALIMVTAIATSLASIIFTGALAVNRHHRRGAVAWRWVLRMAPMIVLGTFFGSTLATFAPAGALKLLFAGYLSIVALRMWHPVAASSVGAMPATGFDSAIALGIGALSAMLGIGGGTLTVPYLLKRGRVMIQAVATASALGLPIAMFGTLSYLFLGWRHHQTPGYFIAEIPLLGILLGSLVATPLAVALAHRLDANRLRQGFALLMALVAVKLLLSVMR